MFLGHIYIYHISRQKSYVKMAKAGKVFFPGLRPTTSPGGPGRIVSCGKEHLAWRGPADTLTALLCQLHRSGANSDVILSTETTAAGASCCIPAHSALLAACSPLLRTVLATAATTDSSSEMRLIFGGGVTDLELGSLVCLLYRGEVRVGAEQRRGVETLLRDLGITGIALDNTWERREDC